MRICCKVSVFLIYATKRKEFFEIQDFVFINDFLAYIHFFEGVY